MSNVQEIQTLIVNDDLLDTLDLFKLAISEDSELNPLSLFCVKTGHEIGKREITTLFDCVKIRGKTELLSTLYNSHGLGIHPAWVQTDPRTLDQLQIADPLGYVCYCLSLMTEQYYSKAFAHKLSYQNANAEKHFALARANQYLKGMSEGELLELSSALCHLLTFAPDTLAYTQRILGKIAYTPDALAKMGANKTLVPALNSAINAAMAGLGEFDTAWRNRKKFEEIASTPSEMARGPSQIRGQRKAKRVVQSAEIDFLLQSLMGVSFDKVHSDRIAEHNKLHGTIEIKLADLADLDLDAMEDEFDEDDDNEIVIRKIPRSIITGTIPGTRTYVQPKPASNSILARLAPKVEAPNLVEPQLVTSTTKTPVTTPAKPGGNSILSRLKRD